MVIKTSNLTKIEDKSNHSSLLTCKFCGDRTVVKYGFTNKYRQRFYCLKCQRTFLDISSLPNMRHSVETIASALDCFYSGKTIPEIQSCLSLDLQLNPHYSTISNWIMLYSRVAINLLKQTNPSTGTGINHQTEVRLKSITGTLYIQDYFDQNSGFLLATKITRCVPGNSLVSFCVSEKSSWNLPSAYKRLECYTNNKTSGKFSRKYIPDDLNVMEKQGTFDDLLLTRTHLIEHLRSFNKINLIIQAWRINYNFFRQSHLLGGKTPAQAALAGGKYHSWADVIEELFKKPIRDLSPGSQVKAKSNIFF